MIYIIGCGGVGSWLALPIIKLAQSQDMEVTLMDGDTLEERNLDRQLFTSEQIGMNKAQALANKYRVDCLTYYYTPQTRPRHSALDILFCCVDNNAARRAVLDAVDENGCTAIIAANEKFSAEAYIYNPQWYKRPLDPRVYYPMLLDDDGLDPAHTPCTGAAAQAAAPQLVSANFMAAALAQSLFVSNIMELPKMDAESIPYVPYRLVSNLTKLLTFRPIDSPEPKEANDRTDTDGGDAEEEGGEDQD